MCWKRVKIPNGSQPQDLMSSLSEGRREGERRRFKDTRLFKLNQARLGHQPVNFRIQSPLASVCPKPSLSLQDT